MPFTPAHPAIVVLLVRWFPNWFSLSALVVGSLSPDFEYFVRLRPARSISHDLIGIPLLCVPTGLLVFIVFERIMKRPLLRILPLGLQARLQHYAKPTPLKSPQDWLIVLGSLALGALSHLFWDAWTHDNGWFVARLPLLSQEVLPNLRIFKIFQHMSTLIGLSLLSYWSVNAIRQTPPESLEGDVPISRKTRGRLIALMSILALTFGGLLTAWQWNEIVNQGVYAIFVRYVVATITAICVFLLILSLVLGRVDRSQCPLDHETSDD